MLKYNHHYRKTVAARQSSTISIVSNSHQQHEEKISFDRTNWLILTAVREEEIGGGWSLDSRIVSLFTQRVNNECCWFCWSWNQHTKANAKELEFDFLRIEKKPKTINLHWSSVSFHEHLRVLSSSLQWHWAIKYSYM